jgi:tRNA modification GTPase
LKKIVEDARQLASQLLQSFRLGNVIKNGVTVAIIGKPNAGKSTLLNALLNEDRAIVSDIPGTTRDTIEEVINIDGILFRLIDTAGLRNKSTDFIENVGIEKSLQKMKQADVVVYLFDVAETMPDELQKTASELLQQNINFILVGNKIDIPGDKEAREKFSAISGVVFLSAKSHTHLEVLKEKMIDVVLQENVQAENVIVTNARHYHALTEVSNSLRDISEGLKTSIPGDLLALDIRRCLQYLGEITGEITNEDQLDYIFSKFCIGK